MHNLSRNEPIWLTDPKGVSHELYISSVTVLSLVNEKRSKNSSYYKSIRKSISIIKGLQCIKQWDIETIDALLIYTLDKNLTSLLVTKVNSFSEFSTNQKDRFATFLRICFLDLWLRKKVVLPLGFYLPAHWDIIIDDLVLKSCNDIAIRVRSVKKTSSIKFEGKISQESRDRKANHWLRLLFNTDFYDIKKVNYSDFDALFNNSVGKGNVLLRRYYVTDFLLFISKGNSDALKYIDDLLSRYNQNRKENILDRKAKKLTEKNKHTVKSDIAYGNIMRERIEKIILHLDHERWDDVSIESLKKFIKNNMIVGNLSRYFKVEEGLDNNPIFKKLPSKVLSLVSIVINTFMSMVKSKRLQRESNAILVLNILLSYLAIYLPVFFEKRDGNLSNYPSDLSDLNCTMYFTRNSFIDDSFISPDAKLPITVVTYLDIFKKVNSWGNETVYSRVKILDEYFDFLVSNKDIFPGLDKVVNTFSSSCYPKLSQRSFTVKQIIPKEIFATFMNMLYSLEFLGMHLNGVMSGDIPVISDGELYFVSEVELRHESYFNGLWGFSSGHKGKLIDLEKLNYTPIFFHNGKAYKFSFIPNFFKEYKTEIKNKPCYRLSLNGIRLSILMCETGIRQKHLMWLNKDRYALALQNNNQSPLAPLIVSTDKSHGEWIAIVSRHVFDLLERQKNDYDSCTLPEYETDLWYGLKNESTFGKFKPLFRMPKYSKNKQSESPWNTFDEFNIFLIILQNIANEVIDEKFPCQLVFYKCDGEKVPIDNYNEEYFIGKNFRFFSSPLSPHGLRASFITNALRFLPPSIIGQFLTGQTEALVMYYQIMNPSDIPDHEELLLNLLEQHIDDNTLSKSPILLSRLNEVNKKLMKDIESNPDKAINTYSLLSIDSTVNGENGLDIIRSKAYSKLAFNLTHICPFDNACPKEVIVKFGENKPCHLCSYAIRCGDNLTAISAEKAKTIEDSDSIKHQIESYLKKDSGTALIDNLEKEWNRLVIKAASLEAIEQQLFYMANHLPRDSFYVADKSSLEQHYVKLGLTDKEYIIKRLIDINNFPDMSSSKINQRVSLLRRKLLLSKSNLYDVLEDQGFEPDSEADQLMSMISSMVQAKKLTASELITLAQHSNDKLAPKKPINLIVKTLK
ncbi:hypothetical protein KIV40_18180 [Vibrio sp. D173a]|uniref:hypothetical protein n=1 Tax=Vibrio sp. D173a TaxID=2836349 RepID=UPI00255727CF|nr:hypothetical protein [Vibrio sp. D173a]MDK9757268.1 hypothetical protein [Vibrio sp. D173a]